MNEEMIRGILSNKLHVRTELLISENDSMPLTGNPFYLDCIEMTYLYLEVQRQSGKVISSECLEEYGFNSISKIASIMQTLF